MWIIVPIGFYTIQVLSSLASDLQTWIKTEPVMGFRWSLFHLTGNIMPFILWKKNSSRWPPRFRQWELARWTQFCTHFLAYRCRSCRWLVRCWFFWSWIVGGSLWFNTTSKKIAELNRRGLNRTDEAVKRLKIVGNSRLVLFPRNESIFSCIVSYVAPSWYDEMLFESIIEYSECKKKS